MFGFGTKIGAGITNKINNGVNIFEFVRNSSYLGALQPNKGAVLSYKRLGRGQASGKGKTAGRGQKGQKARSKVPRWLEGGQTPYYKRFPIIGFNRPHRRVYYPVNLDRIQNFWDNGRIPLQPGETLTIKLMKDCGLATGTVKDGVKLLGNGKEDYNVPLNIEASRASAGVINAIEKVGYKFTARYFTKLGIKAHLNPDEFLLKKGYVPLQARPTHRRDIEFYSNAEKRGYLLENPSLLLSHMGKTQGSKKVIRKSHIKTELDTASDRRPADFSEPNLITLKDL